MTGDNEISFRAANADDLDRLVALAEQCPGAPPWAFSTWRQVLDSAAKGERHVLVALSQDRFVAFGVAGLAGDVAEIESLAVVTAARRRGIARSLCEAFMRWAETRGASRISLEVRISNDAARALYKSIGFQEIAIRRGYYREPDEDGLMMARML